MSTGWEGNKVRLTPLDKARHLDNALLWLNDSETTEFMLTGDFPISFPAEEEYFDNAMKPGADHAQFAIETHDNIHIGFVGTVGEIEWQHRSATVGIVIGPREFRGAGYGVDALTVQARHAFETLGLRLLLAEALIDNKASCQALRKIGYREVGAIPDRYWRRGAFRDVAIFALYAGNPCLPSRQHD